MLEGSLGSKRPGVNLLERKEPSAWHLVPLNKHLGIQCCNYQFRNHKMFYSRKSRSFNICPSICSCPIAFSSALLFVICLFLFVIMPVVSICIIQFCLLILNSFLFLFFLFHLIIRYSVTQSYFVLILEMCSSYFGPHSNNHPASQ